MTSLQETPTTTASTKPALPSGVRAAGVLAVSALSLITALIVLWATGGLVQPDLPGLTVDVGSTVWLLPMFRVLADAAAVVTVGSLLAAVVLVPGLRIEARGRRLLLGAAGFRWVLLGSWAAAAWAVISAVSLVLTASQLLGIPPSRALRAEILLDTARSVTDGQTLAWTLVLAVAVAVLCRYARTLNTGALALGTAVIAVTPAVFAGHTTGAGSHQLAVSAQLLHVVPVTLWLGGLLALLLAHRLSPTDRANAVGRFSPLAAACLALVALSGLVTVSTRLTSWSDLVSTSYGRIVLLKIGVLLAAGVLGWLHRTRSLPALRAGRGGVFGRVAVVEMGVLAVGVGAAVGLAATPTPRVADTGDAATSLLGYPLPAAPSASVLFADWLVDPLIITVAAFAVAAYLVGVVRLRRRGESWPPGRGACWVAAWATIVFVTCGPVATYAPVLFGVHVAQHMALAAVVPILLVLGGPATLALRSTERGITGHGDTEPRVDPAWRGAHGWIAEALAHPVTRMMAHPVMAVGMYAAGLYVMYFTGLFSLMLRSHAVHLVVLVHTVGAGYFFFWLLIGVDAPLARIGPGVRAALLFVAVAAQIGLGFSLAFGDRLLAADWFGTLSRDWGASPLTQQQGAGPIVWVFAAVSLVAVLLVMLAQHRRERSATPGSGSSGR